MDVKDEVVAFIRHRELFQRGAHIVVGVSGGPDSLCLLHVLWTICEEWNVRLHVAHLNHMIRGGDADVDARFVARLAERWDIPCVIQSRDVPALARDRKLAIEEAARRARYAFLARVARSVGAQHIAVGHNADDQSETVLMHWLRGAGLAGLRGMLPAIRLSTLRLISCPDQDTDDLWLIRPLLEIPRQDIERYCREHELAYRYDRSNLDTTFYRNKLRHELLPYLEAEYKSRFREILCRSAIVIRDDYELLCQLRDSAWREVVRCASRECVCFDLAKWRGLHVALQRATLRHAVRQVRQNVRDVNFKHIEAALELGCGGGTGAQAVLPRSVMLTVGYSTLVVADAEFVPPPDFPALSAARVSLHVPGETVTAGGIRAVVQIISPAELPANWSRNPDPWRAFLDAEKLGTGLSLRRRQPSDRFCPLGLGGQHKLVNEFLGNAKVPAWWRDRIPLLVRQDGEIMWVCGWRVDDRARITDKTSLVAVVTLRTEE